MSCCDRACPRPVPDCPRRGTGGSRAGGRPLDPAVLRGLPLFERIAPADLAELLAGSTVACHPRRSLLFGAGEPADCFYVVLCGKVKLFALDSQGHESVVEVVTAVSSFAEAAMFASGSFPLNAELLEDAELARVPAGPFLRSLCQKPALAFTMLANMSRWQRHLVREAATLKLRTPIQRVGAFLLSLTASSSGPATVELPFKKALVASRLGIEPESFSRVMARLRRLGVETAGHQVRIADVAALRALCG